MPMPPLTLQHMVSLAADRGGCFLSKVYTGGRDKHRWRCAEGHEWDAPPSRVKLGSWCPRCACIDHRKHDIEEMQDVALTRGGECLTSEYMGFHKKLKWRCGEGHEWEAAPSKVCGGGQWCAVCSGRSGNLDVYARLAKSQGGRLLSKEYLGAHAKHGWSCARGHHWQMAPERVRSGRWCTQCQREDRKGEAMKCMNAIAKERGGRCLSTCYVSRSLKLKWQCGLNESHKWTAIPDSIKRGSWCPFCVGRVQNSVPQATQSRARPGWRCAGIRIPWL